MSANSTFQHNARVLLKKKKLTYRELGDRVGTPKSYVWKVLNSPCANPTVAMMNRIAEELGTDVRSLLTTKRTTTARKKPASARR